jgi:predicted nucleic acid-binding protein
MKLNIIEYSMIVVDTEILIDYMLGKQQTALKLEIYIGKEQLAITDLSLAEIAYIVQNPISIQNVVEAFEILNFDSDAALQLSTILTYNPNIPFRYLYNASICVSKNYMLLTKNKEIYSRIKNLRLL